MIGKCHNCTVSKQLTHIEILTLYSFSNFRQKEEEQACSGGIKKRRVFFGREGACNERWLKCYGLLNSVVGYFCVFSDDRQLLAAVVAAAVAAAFAAAVAAAATTATSVVLPTS